MLGDKLLFIEENEKHHDIWELIKLEDPKSTKTKANDSYRDEQTAIENEEDEVMQFER